MEDEFEVKGPEEGLIDKHVDGEKETGHFGFASKVALLTAILSTVGAFYSYQAGRTLSEAMMLKNDAAIFKTEAANQWQFYQAKSTKQTVYESVLISKNSIDNKEQIEKLIQRYDTEKEEIKKEALALEGKSTARDQESEKVLHNHHEWAQATTAIQIAIALAAITILTRKRWLYWGALGTAFIGFILGLTSFF